MKVIHYKSTMDPAEGGVVKAVLDLCSMSRTCHSPEIVTFDSTVIPNSMRGGPSAIYIHELPGSIGRSGFLGSAQKSALLDAMKGCDAVHLHAMWNPSNAQVARLCVHAGLPFVLSVHGMLDDWCMSQRRLKKLVYLKGPGRNLLRDAAVIHCTARAELDQASEWFDASKGRVIPLPVDLSEYMTIPDPSSAYNYFDGLDPSRPKIIFLSRIHYKKGVDRLIRASGILNNRGIDHQLVIAGTGDQTYTDRIKVLARDQGISDHVLFLGFVSGLPKLSLLSACDVFALPTSQENFGFVFFEALASGTPVLTTRNTDTWPEIESSGGGVIADNTPEDFANVLGGMLSDTGRCAEMGKAGRAWAMREMDAERVQEAYTDMYQSCIASRGFKREGACL